MKKYKEILNFIFGIYQNRRWIWELTKNELRRRYIGNALGLLWALLQPLLTVLIFWFVFQVGFKAMPVNQFPFILWLICGMFPWFFFCDAINSATNAIIADSYLVKKTVFKVWLLPVVQIVAALLIHSFFLAILFIFFALYGYMPDLYCLQILYYDFALLCLIFGIAMITSTLIVFLKDIGQIVGILLQFGFWGTPIFWSLNMIPETYRWILQCNPMCYIISGYRDAFINKIWFWEFGCQSLWFWLVTFITILTGSYLFKKLRPHFADVI